MTNEELDLRFGQAIEPIEISESEQSLSPKSLQPLNDETAIALRAYIETANQGLKIIKLNHECLIVLWLMDESGQIWFSLEEATYLDDANDRRYHPISRSAFFSSKQDAQKLGHPALLPAPKKARIGGEILYDELDGWLISNKSGRYGRSASIDNLKAAADVWAKFGIGLEVHYLGRK